MLRLLPSTDRLLEARVHAPPSKSVTHRALVAAALASGESEVHRPLVARDTRATSAGLSALGLPVRETGTCWTVAGRSGEVPGGGRLELDESGTSLRLLAAVAALGREPSRIDGAPRLRERPLSEALAALRELGAGIHGERLPLSLGGTPFRGGEVSVDGSRSSQFASALLLIGPCLPDGLVLRMPPPVVSLPYVELTCAVMRDFGVDVAKPEPLVWQVPGGGYRPTSFSVEGDHSSSSYFLAAPLVAGGRVRVEALDAGSSQADACFLSILEQLGATVRHGERWVEVASSAGVPSFDLSLGHAPDLVPTVAALGLFAEGRATIRDVAHLRLKESDRIEQIARNLRRLGRPVEARDDRLEIGPPAGPPTPGRVETAGDHRIAMAFALAGLAIRGVEVDDDACVDKSNPDFWNAWESMLPGFRH